MSEPLTCMILRITSVPELIFLYWWSMWSVQVRCVLMILPRCFKIVLNVISVVFDWAIIYTVFFGLALSHLRNSIFLVIFIADLVFLLLVVLVYVIIVITVSSTYFTAWHISGRLWDRWFVSKRNKTSSRSSPCTTLCTPPALSVLFEPDCFRCTVFQLVASCCSRACEPAGCGFFDP